MAAMDHHERRASALLAIVRETPMIRSNPKRARQPLWEAMTAAFVDEGAMPHLAKRVAMQLVLKIEANALAQRSTWRAIGSRLVRETERLRTGIGLVDRQIIVALPKLSADVIEGLLE